jgi:hypothetical protein
MIRLVVLMLLSYLRPVGSSGHVGSRGLFVYTRAHTVNTKRKKKKKFAPDVRVVVHIIGGLLHIEFIYS